MNVHWDNTHVVTCNRDRWQFERLIMLLNALEYPGVLRVYVNEYDEERNSWHVWFKNVYRECNRIFRRNIRVTDVEAIPGMSLAEHQHRSGKPRFSHYYVQQQLVKLYDVHTHTVMRSVWIQRLGPYTHGHLKVLWECRWTNPTESKPAHSVLPQRLHRQFGISLRSLIWVAISLRCT